MEKYQRNTQVIDGTIDSSQVIMHVERGKYFGLNPIGKRIWELIEKPKNIEEITAQSGKKIILFVITNDSINLFTIR